jgi:hypothetical protein
VRGLCSKPVPSTRAALLRPPKGDRPVGSLCGVCRKATRSPQQCGCETGQTTRSPLPRRLVRPFTEPPPSTIITGLNSSSVGACVRGESLHYNDEKPSSATRDC